MLGLIFVVLVPVCGAAVMLYVAFVRKPANNPQEFLNEGRAAATDTLVVSAGSSTTHASASADYVAMLRDRLRQRYEFVNAGVNGNTSQDLLHRMDRIVACRPDAVTILIGVNDARNDASPGPSLDAYRDNLEAILARLRTETDARVALLSLQPVGEDLSSATNRRVVQYNAVIRDVAARYDAAYLPLYEQLSAIIRKSGHRPPAPYDFSFTSVFLSALRHYAGRHSWDEIGASNGFAVHTDGIHLNNRAATVVADLVEGWLRGSDPARKRSAWKAGAR